MAFTLLSPCLSRAEETYDETFTFRGVEDAIKVKGLSSHTWVNDDSTSMDAELVLVFSNADENVVKSITSTKRFTARVLAVGGGGAGGTARSSSQTGHPGGGGGGAGELVDRKDVDFAGSTLYTLTIGAGGKAQGSPSEAKPGGPGGESAITFGTDDLIRVKGGGGGGGESVGQSGGSGGGGSGDGTAGGEAVTNEKDGKGNNGGTSGKRYAAGGGGAGSKGDDGSTGTSGGTGGKGGDGVESDIIWNNVRYYAGGGGGGNTASGAGGAGGKGGGGAGSVTATSAAAAVAPTPGTDGLGGGGGGGGRFAVGAAGGSGIIVIRITWIQQEMQWADPFPITVGGRTGTIQLDKNATTNWVDGDLVITYTDTVIGGGLKFSTAGTGDEQKIWANARVLVVGGGGGGGFVGTIGLGMGGGGGGGAGGFAETNGVILCSGDGEYEILVGAGGAAGTSEAGEGDNGSASSFKIKEGEIICEGKGGGGGGAKSAGKTGASGGGGSQVSNIDQRDGGAGIAGQGFDGGIGNQYRVGGGGGGAGGAGQAANEGGNGGDGKASDISGNSDIYAIGGSGYGATAGGMDGADNFGNGGGGGADTTPAGKGGSGIVIVRLSGFIVGGLPELKPNQTKFTYNGDAQSPINKNVPYFWAYGLQGVTVATNADDYAYAVAIREGLTCDWLSGGHEPKDYRWEINPLAVELPEILPKFAANNPDPEKFDNTKKTAVSTWDAKNWMTNGVDGAHHYWMGLEVGDHTNTFWYCTLKDYQQTNAGVTNLTATLRQVAADETSFATNFVWKSGKWAGTKEDAKVAWQIGQADNAITDLVVPDVQKGNTINPTCSWTWQSVANTYSTPRDAVVYTYYRGEKQPARDEDYNLTEKPTTNGTFWVHAYICKDSKHEPGNWVEAHAYAKFVIWRHPSETLTDFVNITVDNTNAKALPDFPILLRISEARIKGFTYDRAGADGSAIRFVQLTDKANYTKLDSARATDQLLPYEIAKWDPSGESLIWVKINPKEISSSAAKGFFRMYWHRNNEELIPDFGTEKVWSAYTGVWHMDEEISAVDAANTKSADATKNGLDLVPDAGSKGDTSRMVSTSGVMGNARVIESQLPGTWGNHLVLDGTELESFALGGTFVFSTWVKINDYMSWPILVSRKSSNGGNGGWSVELSNDDRKVMVARGNGDTSLKSTVFSDDPKILTEYTHVAFVYNGTNLKVYSNGKEVGSTTKLSAVTDNGRDLYIGGGYTETENPEYSICGSMDEIRLRKSSTSDTWAAAEYEMVATTNACSFGLVNKPYAKDETQRSWIDYWTTEPSLKHYWDDGELNPTKINNGKGALRSGAPLLGLTNTALTYFVSTLTNNVPLATVPTEPGAYSVEYRHTVDKDSYGQVWDYFDGTRLFDIEIIGHDPQTEIDPSGATESGRILLGNDDTNATAQVTGQSYFSPRWTHSLEAPPELGVNLYPGYEHTFTNAEGKTLWKLSSIYFGNMLSTNRDVAVDKALTNCFNTLPWARTNSLNSFDPTTYEEPFDWHQTGHLVMRNVKGAAIESGVYTNGIGTIYFDVVNALTNAQAAALKLVVQISESDAEEYWENIDVMRIRYSNGSKSFSGPTNVVDCLNVANGGKTAQYVFYRVYAQVPVSRRATARRFRICRMEQLDGTAPEGGHDPDDPAGFILLDNIIASFAPPVPKFEPCGAYDKSRSGQAILGVETAFDIPYPALGDELYGRARLVSGDTNAVTSARFRYRYRYLNSAMDPAQPTGREAWNILLLEQVGDSNEFRTTGPLAVGSLSGDIEYYFDVTATVPFYKYTDYSGLTLDVPLSTKTNDNYSEEPRGDEPDKYRSTFGNYPSRGKDWFVRLREFSSPTRGYRLIATNELETVTNEMVFVDKGLWRGLLRTAKPKDKYAKEPTNFVFRIEREVPTNPGATNLIFATTAYWAGAGVDKLPNTLSLAESTGADEWTQIPRDGTTGYIMFQLSENDAGVPGQLSVVHADYQNFNQWDDAQKEGDAFVGNSTEDDKKTGVGSEKRAYGEDFGKWTDTPATNSAWRETFSNGSGTFTGWGGFDLNTPFDKSETPNGWNAGPGQWINQNYRVAGSSGAFQMEGAGLGYLECLEATPKLRGLESISLSTRLAQSIQFDDIAYEDLGERYAREMTNYTFVTQFAMSPNDWNVAAEQVEQFDGAGQVSLVAFYQPMKGCYELRVTRTDTRTMRLQLFKWHMVDGQMVAEPLGTEQGEVAFSNENNTPFLKYNNKYAQLYFSASRQADGSVKLQAGVSRGRTAAGTLADSKSLTLCYWDTKPAQTYGTYGLTSANCPAMFISPRLYSGSVKDWLGGDTKDTLSYHKDNTQAKYVINPTGDLTTFSADDLEFWAWKEGRIEIDKTLPGFRADFIPQKLFIQWKPSAQGGTWTNLVVHPVNSFLMSTVSTYKQYRVEDGVYRFTHGGARNDAKVDIVIDNVELKQWRGEDTNENMTWAGKGDATYGWRTNFVMTSGWIANNRVKLSAKRTKATYPASIRSPLLDGDRSGVGLGMLSIEYANAQPNVNLLVQIATNGIYEASAKELMTTFEGWTTVTNFDFSTMTADQRHNGSLDVYLGLHGVEGMMRIVLDPEVVKEVQAAESKDESRFGEIEITKIYCRDEPKIDQSSWWGWNLRTIGAKDTGSRWDNGYRTFLADYSETAGESGLSLALNRSISEDVVPGEEETYKQHAPFVQTPTLQSPVGEVTFKARMFALDGSTQWAEVAVYGSEDGDADLPDKNWNIDHPLARFVVSNTVYSTYHFRAPSSAYRAFRLAVTGVKGVAEGSRGPDPTLGPTPVRVLLDEIVVSEALYPKLGFKYLYPVRTGLTDNKVSPCFDDTLRVPLCDEQPLVGENWTVQAEVEVKQLPDELDLSKTPRVFFYHYNSRLPWGFSKWEAKAEPIELAHAVDAKGNEEKMIFRGSFSKAPTAVVDAPVKDGEVVQYAAKVVYWDASGSCHTDAIERAEWKRPEWYNPLDYNVGKPAFSPFAIFERIAPNRAWINEINVFDGRDDEGQYLGDQNQYVEIAAPVDQPLNGWWVEYIDNGMVTNTLCTFGTEPNDIVGTKSGPETNDYVFLVVQSPATEQAKTWKDVMRPDGTKVVIDGTWRGNFGDGGKLDNKKPVALRLVRPSGIVEQEIAFEGTNTWPKTESRSLETFVKKLNAGNPSAHSTYYAVGNECGNASVVGLEGRSLGVVTNTGAVATEWKNTMHQTPGWVNEGQIVPKNYVLLPNGEMVIITAKVEGGHIVQTLGTKTNVTDRIQLTVQKGGPGTNIVYKVDPYYEIESVKTNDWAMAGVEGSRGEGISVTVAAGVSNNVTVVAKARLWNDFETMYGLPANSRYRAAIADWLENRTTLRGQFKNRGEIHLGEFRDLAGNFVTNLTIVDTYWLDMDPTEAGWWFQAGITKAPAPEYRAKSEPAKAMSLMSIVPVDPPTPEYVENFKIKVKMQMTNTVSGDCYAPYVLRGAKPGETSIGYDKSTTDIWNSATFKVTGDIQNDMPMRQRWVPLRWFYFLPGSFDANNETEIEIWDPFDASHGGTTAGWEKYKDKPVFYSWAIDERNMPVTIEALAPDSTFSDTTK